MTTQTKAQVIWLDPECNEWDRREWESLWSMDELRSGQWEYQGTMSENGCWFHQFQSQGVQEIKEFSCPAYVLWLRMR